MRTCPDYDTLDKYDWIGDKILNPEQYYSEKYDEYFEDPAEIEQLIFGGVSDGV